MRGVWLLVTSCDMMLCSTIYGPQSQRAAAANMSSYAMRTNVKHNLIDVVYIRRFVTSGRANY